MAGIRLLGCWRAIGAIDAIDAIDAMGAMEAMEAIAARVLSHQGTSNFAARFQIPGQFARASWGSAFERIYRMPSHLSPPSHEIAFIASIASTAMQPAPPGVDKSTPEAR
jgi:hypothetical protein